MSDLRCAECGRNLEAAPCGLVHAISRLQIHALRQMIAALFTAAEATMIRPSCTCRPGHRCTPPIDPASGCGVIA